MSDLSPFLGATELASRSLSILLPRSVVGLLGAGLLLLTGRLLRGQG